MHILRVSLGPISTREIVDRTIPEYHLDLATPDDHKVLLHKVHKVRNTLSRRVGRGLLREQRGDGVYWSMKEAGPGEE